MILDETRQSEKSAPVRVAECAFEGYSIYIRLELVFMNADYSCHFIMPHLLGIRLIANTATPTLYRRRTNWQPRPPSIEEGRLRDDARSSATREAFVAGGGLERPGCIERRQPARHCSKLN